MATTNRGRPGLFAHLLGLGKRAAEEDGDDDKDKKDKSEDDESAEDEGKDKKGKKAKSEDDDESAEDEDKDKKAARRERTRCALIVAHGVSTGMVQQAGILAFDTDISAASAIATLTAMGGTSTGKGRLAERMASAPAPKVGAGDAGSVPAGSAGALVAQMTAVYDKATNKK